MMLELFSSWMTTELAWVSLVVLIAFVTGILSGLLGIGGGLMIVPALLGIPKLLALPLMPVAQVTALSAAQGAMAGMSAFRQHRKGGFVRRDWVMPLAVTSLVFPLGAAYFSVKLEPWLVKTLLASVIVSAFVMVWRRKPHQDSTQPPAWSWHKGLPMLTGSASIGTLSGTLGVGGAFFMNPLLWTVGGLPLKYAIATGSALMALTTLSTAVGKAMAGVMPWQVLPWALLGSFLGARLGGKWMSAWKPEHLKRLQLAVYLLALTLLCT
ncbi:MAG: sulfite exporter TauE/SafE family protein [Vampirovibrionales bacterium]